MTWVAYRKKYGSLSAAVRVEEVGAQIASLFANANFKSKSGQPFSPSDFLPREKGEERAIDLETAMQTWA